MLLTGEVPTAQDKEKLEQATLAVENVRSVVNDLAVMPPRLADPTFNDTLITGKVRASFVDAKDLFASAYKVVTERETVYLMGRVTQREADRASDIARGVNGVRKVVRVFEIITQQELERGFAQQRPAPVTTDASPNVPVR